MYGSLWLVYNVNWTPFIARIEGWTFKLNKMYSNFGQSQLFKNLDLKKIKVKMYRRNFHAIGQLMVKSIRLKFPHTYIQLHFFVKTLLVLEPNWLIKLNQTTENKYTVQRLFWCHNFDP